jgi:hypothetical protein
VELWLRVRAILWLGTCGSFSFSRLSAGQENIQFRKVAGILFKVRLPGSRYTNESDNNFKYK